MSDAILRHPRDIVRQRKQVSNDQAAHTRHYNVSSGLFSSSLPGTLLHLLVTDLSQMTHHQRCEHDHLYSLEYGQHGYHGHGFLFELCRNFAAKK